MGKASCEATFEFPDFLSRFEQSRDRIERTIAASIQTQVGLRFDAEGSYHGHDKWKKIRRQGQILSLSGTLRKSIAPPAADGRAGTDGFVRSEGGPELMTIEVGTKVIYASVHNDGAVIRHPGTENGFGMKILIPPHDIPMPRRNFTEQNQQDTDEISQTVANLVAAILEEAT